MDETVSVLIADDEELVRKGIRCLLAETGNYRVVGEAENGGDLIDKITVLRPQVIILDVRMPVMDGLTALEKIRVSFPKIKVVILSGYNDFDLLKKAIQLGVTDYLLKPCDPEEFRRVLEKVKTSLFQEEQERLEKERMEAKVQSCFSAFLEKTLYQLLKNELSPSDLRERTKLLDVENQEVIVLVAALRNSYQVISSMDPNQHKCFCSRMEENIRSTLEHMGCKIMSILRENSCTFVVILSSFRPIPVVARALLDELRKKALQDFLIVYSDRATLVNLYEAYQQAMRSLRQKLFFAFMEAQEPSSPATTFFPEAIWGDLFHSLRLGDKAMVTRKLEELFGCLDRNRGGPTQYAQLAFYIAETAFHLAFEEGLTVPNVFNPFMQSREIEKLHTRDDFFTWLQKYLEAILEILQRKNAGFSWAVRKCLQLLDEHCCENVSLAKLASMVDLNPTYLSFLIKRETGKNFSEHLMERRMAIARKLLKREGLNVSEVARRVGYENVRSFSEAFRRCEGVTPRQFRQGQMVFSREQKISDKIKK